MPSQAAKLHKNLAIILANHTKLLHVAQNFDILRNTSKKVLKKRLKCTIIKY